MRACAGARGRARARLRFFTGRDSPGDELSDLADEELVEPPSVLEALREGTSLAPRCRSRRAAVGMESVYRGHEGVRRFWRDAISVFGEIDFEVDEFTEAGDQVLAVGREREVGRASGAPVEATHVAVWTLADRMVTQMQLFDDRQQALEAAGLSE